MANIEVPFGDDSSESWSCTVGISRRDRVSSMRRISDYRFSLSYVVIILHTCKLSSSFTLRGFHKACAGVASESVRVRRPELAHDGTATLHQAG